MVKVLEKVVGRESITPASYADDMWSLYGLFYDVADVFVFIMEVPHAFYFCDLVFGSYGSWEIMTCCKQVHYHYVLSHVLHIIYGQGFTWLQFV